MLNCTFTCCSMAKCVEVEKKLSRPLIIHVRIFALLTVHQRRMCLVQIIPGQNNQLHRLERFCSRMVGTFFDEFPLIGNAEGARRCCEQLGDMDRITCLTEEKRMHYDEVCALKRFGKNTTVEPEKLGRVCCHLEGEDRYTCMDKKALLKAAKARKAQRQTRRRNELKLERLCNVVDHSTVRSQSREDFETCCEVEDIDEALLCFREAEEENYDRLCARQIGNRHPRRLHPCCSQEGDERYECFDKRQPKRNFTSVDGNSTDSEEVANRRFSEKPRPTRMQRICGLVKKTSVHQGVQKLLWVSGVSLEEEMSSECGNGIYC